MGEGESTQTPRLELLPPGESTGLNELLRNPSIVSKPQSNLGQNIEVRVINTEEWKLLYSILGRTKLMMDESSRLDREGGSNIYTLEVPVKRDNGIFFAFENSEYLKQTTAVYLSDFPYEYGGENPPPGEKIRCHQIKMTSRREVAPNIFTCSDIIFRVTPDFKVIEGDPVQAELLKSRGMFTNNKTFLFGMNTKYHTSYIEVMDPETGAKQLSPLIPEAKKAWDIVLDAGSGAQELMSRMITGTATEEDFKIIEPAVNQLGDVQFIDTSLLIGMGKALAGKFMAQAAATLRSEPVELAYLEDLNHNLQTSKVRTIKPDVLSRENIVLEKYLAKRASRLPPMVVGK